MIIDFSQFISFWKNPRVYEIEYDNKLEPDKARPYFDVGHIAHAVIENSWWTKSIAMEHAKSLHYEDSFEEGWLLGQAILRYRETVMQRVVDKEIEWIMPIGNGHFMAGKVDEVVERYDIFPGDFKSMSSRGTLKMAKEEVEQEWDRTIQGAQALFGLIGMQYYSVIPKGSTKFQVTVVMKTPIPKPTKKNPNPVRELDPEPIVFTHMTEKSIEEQKDFINTVEDTCDYIDMLRGKRGKDPNRKFPHIVQSKWSSYGCRVKSCDYEEICHVAFEGVPNGYRIKQRYLNIEGVK